MLGDFNNLHYFWMLFKINLIKDFNIFVMKTLEMLKKGERAVIKQMLSEELSARLLEIGMLPGKEIQLVRKAPFGNPLYLKISGNHLSIGKEEACTVVVQ